MAYTPYHDIRDEAKLSELVASMQVHGWQGAPLVADGDQLITGSHRYVAAEQAGIVALVVDIRDIYPEWDALHAEYGAPTIDESDYTFALADLPTALREEYGIDAH
jgi:hypothetical protein